MVFCFLPREASVWFSAVFSVSIFIFFLKILFRRGMGVETRTKPSNKVAQNVSNDLGWPNAVKILPIRLCVCVVRLQTTMYYKVTRFASLFFCVCLVFFIFVNSVVIFHRCEFFLFVLYIDNDSFVRFCLAVSPVFYDDILSF